MSTKPEKLSILQVVLMLTISRMIFSYSNIPMINTPPSNQDLWLVVIVGALYDYILCFPLLYLSQKFKGMNLYDYSEKIVGKFIAKLLGLMLVGFFVASNILYVSMNTGFLATVVLPETPIWVTIAIFLGVCIYSASKGLLTQGRLAEVIALVLLGSIILFTILNLKNMHMKVFTPILKTSKFSEFNFGALASAAMFYQIIILAQIAPQINGKKSVLKSFTGTILVSTVFIIIVVGSILAVFGIKQAQHSNLPYYNVIQQISVLDSIERIEAIFLISWFLGVFFNVSLNLYISSEVMSKIFKSKSNKVFLLPLAAIVFIIITFTKIKKATIFVKFISHKFLPYLQFGYIFVIPLFLLIIYLLRKKSIDRQQKNSK